MKCHQFLLVLFLGLLVVVSARKHKKVRRIEPKSNQNLPPPSDAEDDVFNILDKDEEYEKSQEKFVESPPEEIPNVRVSSIDVCEKVHCGAGMVCEIDINEEPQCVCISNCPIETEPRRKVCSNHNETWTSDCSVYQQRCWCKKGDERCKGDQYKHVHIEYYGECHEMKKCGENEMADFPRRMRDWLFNVMRDLADRNELPAHYLKMEREAETNMTKRWTNAAVWKWCDLDGHPPDRSVSRHELFPIRAPLLALEHCIAPFLDGCDANNDHRVTLSEWAKCLEIDEDEIDDKCGDIEDRQTIPLFGETN